MFFKPVNPEKLAEKINQTDWTQYIGPDCYDAKCVAPALLDLLNLNENKNAETVTNNILFAIGNNHRGTYYPVMFSALEILLTIEHDETNPVRKNCTYAILNDLHYFEPEIGNYKGATSIELERFVQKYLHSYADET